MTISAIEKFDEMHRPLADMEWNRSYLRVVTDPRFKVCGLTVQDIVDISFHLNCWNKTAQDLRDEVPR